MIAFPISHYGSVNDPKTLKTNLISLWEMDDLSGAIIDDHASNDLAVYNGALQNQSGIMNRCVDLDGDNDYIRHAVSDNRFTPASAHSTSIWFRREGDSINDTYGILMSKMYSSTGYRVFYVGILDSNFGSSRDNEMIYDYYDSANVQTRITYNSGGSNIWTDNWVHVVTTRSGANVKIYINGDLKTSGSGGNGSGKQTTSTNVHFCLGAFWKSTTQPDTFFNGKIDQTGVWSKALTQEEITFLYNKGSGIAYGAWGS